VKQFPFGFCNHCVRGKHFTSRDFFFVLLSTAFAGLLTFGWIYAGVGKNQPIAFILTALLFYVGAISFTYAFARKVGKPDRNTNKDIVHWFVDDIVNYCDERYGVRPRVVFHK
jgi:hypothetical protein